MVFAAIVQWHSLRRSILSHRATHLKELADSIKLSYSIDASKQDYLKMQEIQNKKANIHHVCVKA